MTITSLTTPVRLTPPARAVALSTTVGFTWRCPGFPTSEQRVKMRARLTADGRLLTPWRKSMEMKNAPSDFYRFARVESDRAYFELVSRFDRDLGECWIPRVDYERASVRLSQVVAA